MKSPLQLWHGGPAVTICLRLVSGGALGLGAHTDSADSLPDREGLPRINTSSPLSSPAFSSPLTSSHTVQQRHLDFLYLHEFP